MLKMTSFGRGRGWGNPQNKECALRRPGESASPKDDDYAQLFEKINELSLDKTNHNICNITALVNTIVHQENFGAVFSQLYKQAIHDKAFGLKLIIPYTDDTFQKIRTEERSAVLRYQLFQHLQHDFERKEELRAESTVLFHNYISLLGGVYCSVPPYSKVRLSVLEVPLFTCLHMLLETCTVEDIEVLLVQIFKNGRKLHTWRSELLEELIMDVRKVLVVRNVSSVSRGMLLLIIDLANHKYNTLPDDLKEFYTSQLGSKIFEH